MAFTHTVYVVFGWMLSKDVVVDGAETVFELEPPSQNISTVY